MDVPKLFGKTFIMLTTVVLIFSHFTFISSADQENIPNKDGYQGVYYTDFGDSGNLSKENWGFSTYAASLSTIQEEIDGNSSSKLKFHIEDQSGGRVATKELDESVMGEDILVTFDWYPGKNNDKGEHPEENAGEFRIADGSGNTVFTLNNTNHRPLTFFTGNNDPQETNMTNQETWYEVEVLFDLIDNQMELRLTDKETEKQETYTSSLDNVSFDGAISTLRLVGVRTSGNNHTWTTYLDNIGIYHQPIDDQTITSVQSLPYHRVYVNETSEDIASIGLPDEVPVTLADNSSVEVSVDEWKEVDKEWNPNKQGVYEFEGTLEESEAVNNPFQRTATLYVYNRLHQPETNRHTEWLDRGAIALPTEEGMFISWRLLQDEYEKDVTFNLYRNDKQLNDQPITMTNFTDAKGTVDDMYKVETIFEGKVIQTSTVATTDEDHFSIPLQKPKGGTTPTGDYTYSANDASVGDLDGDGQYEVILKWRPSNAMTALQDVITGPTIFDAYELDGTLLWRMNMGMNLTSGPQYHQFVVGDMNADGKSEFLIKTADATTVYGTTDGTYDSQKVISEIGNPEDDGKWINDGGHVVDGPEYISVFDGETGEEIDTIDYAFPVEKEEGDQGASWGDTFYNRSDRFLSGLAYLDGKTPSAIYGRGYYERTTFAAYSLQNGELTEDWTFDTDEHDGYGEGLGNHNLSTGDVDNDGFDEIIAGSLTLDQDGSILYAMDGEMGRVAGSHGDALHVGAFDPDKEGLHVFGVREAPEVASLEYHDGATGETLQAFYAYKDAGRGVAANITSNPGYEFWGAGGLEVENGGGVYNVQGPVEADSFRDIGLPVNFTTYWDGDLLHELLDHTSITKYDEDSKTANVIEEFEDVVSNNGTKANPSLQADILGDWREEIIFPTEDSSELRLFSTTIPTEYRLPTLMHDTVYRMGIAWQNTTYNQPPHIGYYLGEDMSDQVLDGDLDFSEVDYTPNIEALRHLLSLETTSNDHSILPNKLDQAKHHLEKGRPEQAAKQIEDFITHLQKSDDLSNEMKEKITTDASVS
ncbi:s-layer domain-containing protein [Gracilibacillus halophilus YIM-C55.5]|uniref:S-layer domain-containing protein n=1 Tax=Gracilibacillus halophilus YIM-C55.5 TaxID=1308866 RepID=N4W6P8_9BACI|nr:Ig-like domain-containing protein [Gracilibacillus halophilus]ENH95903.1 s-layer domain-containing protein [Gracilibacillus halophilus YIM-C55.5]